MGPNGSLGAHDVLPSLISEQTADRLHQKITIIAQLPNTGPPIQQQATCVR